MNFQLNKNTNMLKTEHVMVKEKLNKISAPYGLLSNAYLRIEVCK